MSNLSIAPIRALFDTRMNQEDIILLGILCTYTDEDGYCFPGLETISKIISPIVGRDKVYDPSSISKKLGRLEERGYIVKKGQRHTEAGSFKSNKYKVVYDQSIPLEFDRRAVQAPLEKPSKENQAPLETAQAEIHTNDPVVIAPAMNDPVSTGDAKIASPQPDQSITFESLERMNDEPAQPVKDAAIKVFKEVRGRFPPKEHYAEIERVVGCEPVELDFWRKVLLEYSAIGWNRESVRGPLDWFKKRELPHIERKTGGGARENPGVAFAKRHGLMEDEHGDGRGSIEGVFTVSDDLSRSGIGERYRPGRNARGMADRIG